VAETTAEVIYSAPDAAAVRLDSSASPVASLAGEVSLFAFFAGHVFADIGAEPWATDFSSWLAARDPQEFATTPDVMGVRVDPAASPSTARVGFAAWLFHQDDVGPGFFVLGDQRFWRLKVHVPRRERKDSNRYFSTSVALLLHGLLRAHDDAEQQRRLLQAAGIIAALHADGELRLPIAWTHAVSIATESQFGIQPRDWIADERAPQSTL